MTKKFTVSAFGWMVITNYRGERVLANCERGHLVTEDEQEARAYINSLLDQQKRDKVSWNYINLTTEESFI